jgi:anti-sigma factor RsiW
MMNDPATPVHEDELHAYVDGQLDAGRAAAVHAWLLDHADDAHRVATWQAQRLQLRQAARSLDIGPTPPPLAELVMRAAGHARARARWQHAAAAAILLAVGAAGGAWWGRGAAPGSGTHLAAPWAAAPAFVREAGVAHAVFTPEKRHPVEVAASDEAHLVQWLSRRLGTPLKAPTLVEQGWRLLGGRLLPGEGAPRAQFMYENAQGGRMTLYVAAFAPGSGTDTSFRSVREGGRESFYWVEGSFGYALSAELPPAQVQALAREVYTQLSR